MEYSCTTPHLSFSRVYACMYVCVCVFVLNIACCTLYFPPLMSDLRNRLPKSTDVTTLDVFPSVTPFIFRPSSTAFLLSSILPLLFVFLFRVAVASTTSCCPSHLLEVLPSYERKRITESRGEECVCACACACMHACVCVRFFFFFYLFVCSTYAYESTTCSSRVIILYILLFRFLCLCFLPFSTVVTGCTSYPFSFCLLVAF